QALFLRNSSFVADQSKLAADRLLAVDLRTSISAEPNNSETSGIEQDLARITLATRWALGRVPTETEQTAALQLVQETRAAIIGDDKTKDANTVERDAWSAWFLTLFTTAEFRYLVDIEI
ncbi:MAG TPA: hypothetical protein PLR25_20715, partial [Planctomycetaceae bacterium]|nr:hypothetical protein [Planctomycetaceae bacterium]